MVTRKYSSLTDYLAERDADTVEMSFDEVGELVGGLPPSAFTYPRWWSLAN